MIPTITMTPGFFMLLVFALMLASGSVGYLIAWQIVGEKVRELLGLLRIEREVRAGISQRNDALQARITQLREALEEKNDGEQWRRE